MNTHPFKIIGVTLIAFTLTFVILYSFVIQPFVASSADIATPTPFKTISPHPSMTPYLSTARNLVGTWNTDFATKFYIKTDFQTVDMQDVGSQDRTMTWKISATSDSNVVNVEIQFITSNTQVIDGSGYVPDVSPMFAQGLVSGSRLILQSDGRTIGTFNFTQDLIKGTWNDEWSMAYGQQVYTATDGLVLSRN